MNDKEKVWDRLKNGIKPQPTFDMEKLRTAFMQGARSMGKTTMSLQAFGRALRDVNEKPK